jgi:putative toxin-antitoxin system antitoxin component (TIGR02293 family)
VFKDKEMARKWLKEPAWARGDVPPLEFAETEVGAQEVDDLLGRIEHEVFT